ncbi:MAG TPA: thiamine pyrophosphate-dependent enzyme [bacterium]|nr:thiamine pyrophosphate-dependent enzyme [bacterium]
MLAKVALFEMLRDRGTAYVFGNPGTTELNFVEMFADYPQITYVLALQDAIPVGMAYGLAQATGQPAFVNLHITPGLANGLGNIFNAYKAKTPLVITAGQVDRRMILQEPTLWSDLARLASQYTKWSYEARTGADIPIALARAFKTAAAPPPGPVFLSLPMDCLDEDTNGPEPWTDVVSEARPPDTVLERVAETLAGAGAPVLITGSGAATPAARRALIEIAEATGARVYGERLPVRSVFPTNHPQYLGMIGLSLSQLRTELGDADVVLVAGAHKFASLLYTPPVRLAARTTVIHIDPDVWEIGKNIPVTLGVVGDPGAILPDVAERLRSTMTDAQRHRARRRAGEVRRERDQREERWRMAATLAPGQPMTQEFVYRTLGEIMDDTTTVVDEAITAARIIDRYLPLRTEQSYLGIAAGSLGLGLPASLGAQLAWPERRVICTIGDGSLMYTVQALWTAARYRIPVTVLVMDNRAYQVLKDGMVTYKGGPVPAERLVGMDLVAPAVDIPRVAEGFGVPARLISRPDELRQALGERSEGPQLYDIVIE